MTGPDIFAAAFTLFYMLGAFFLAMGAAVVGRFVLELWRSRHAS
jgi:hypothetical protein